MNEIKHVLTGMEFNAEQLSQLIELAQKCKQNPSAFSQKLKGKALILLFEKPSFRTRLSFTRAMQLLGGEVIESVSATRKHETPQDLASVMNGYADAVMVRTHDDQVLQDMAQVSTIPIINGLSANHHPCQVLADLCVLKEVYGSFNNLVLSYIGDGNNVLHSLILMASKLGVSIQYCCPASRKPDMRILETAHQYSSHLVKRFDTPQEAVVGANAVYTDVWQSMGCEEVNERQFEGFQVNEALMGLAEKEAIFMHCMPMERGKEVSVTLPDQACSKIFLQSEYRLYAQMAILLLITQK